jgi:hypothetical protein
MYVCDLYTLLILWQQVIAINITHDSAICDVTLAVVGDLVLVDEDNSLVGGG